MAQKSSEARSLDLVRVFLAEHALRLHDAQNLLDWGGLQELENWMRFMASRHHMAVPLDPVRGTAPVPRGLAALLSFTPELFAIEMHI